MNQQATQFQLPRAAQPNHYDLTIRTDIQELAFDGVVKINLDIHEDTKTIAFNLASLEIGQIKLISTTSDGHKSIISIDHIATDEVTERVTLSLRDTLLTGSNAILSVIFKGELGEKVNGYFTSSWINQGKKEVYTCTQLSPIAARRAFPCWDEPQLKARYTINLISREGTVNLSNMPAISDEPYHPDSQSDNPDFVQLERKAGTDWKLTRFQTTPPMSSYIVAFASGPFKYLEKFAEMPLSGKTLPLRVYTTPDLLSKAEYVLGFTAKILPIYENLFQVEYPLPKLDTLVVTNYGSGAMENWGLVIGQTTLYLFDPEKSGITTKQRIVHIQCHEVAHMWFGNITTMVWWNYLYLNEGFATLIAEVVADKIYPEWKLKSQSLTRSWAKALTLDAKPSSHPIEMAPMDAQKVSEIFDDVSYAKSASVLRMLLDFVGEEPFLRGVSQYLKKHLYGSSVTNDLWDALSNTTGINIAQLMDNWIVKIGYPVLLVTESPGSIHVRQERFLETGRPKPEDDETIWNVPLNILSAGPDGKPSVDRSVLLQAREQSFAIDTSKPWKLNASTSGVYRVSYTPERLNQIAAEAAKKDSIFGLDDRIGLLCDAVALSKAGFTKLSSVLTLIDAMSGETDYFVWSVISETLVELMEIWWMNEQVVSGLRSFARKLFLPIVQKTGYDYSKEEDESWSLLRTCAVSAAVAANAEPVITELRSRFDHFLKTGDESRIPPELQRAVYRMAVRHGGKSEYDAIIKIWKESNVPDQSKDAVFAVGESQDPKTAKTTFEFVINDSKSHEINGLFTGLRNNSLTKPVFIEHFKANYDQLYKQLEGSYLAPHILTAFVPFITTRDGLRDIQEFFKTKETSLLKLSLGRAFESINSNIEYIERSTGDLVEWLGKQQESTS